MAKKKICRNKNLSTMTCVPEKLQKSWGWAWNLLQVLAWKLDPFLFKFKKKVFPGDIQIPSSSLPSTTLKQNKTNKNLSVFPNSGAYKKLTFFKKNYFLLSLSKFFSQRNDNLLHISLRGIELSIQQFFKLGVTQNNKVTYFQELS